MKHFKNESPVGVPAQSLIKKLKQAQSESVKNYKPRCLACGDTRGKTIITESGEVWQWCNACKDTSTPKASNKFQTKDTIL
jgi:hypothetical protein